jgi:hypothetical protein
MVAEQVGYPMPRGSDLPSLSIVTPSYNQEKFVETTLRSVLDQDYPHLEYIVIDDSTDRSPAIIRRYEPRARLISGPKRGFGEALNVALRLCTGDLMAWINADDFYLPGAFQTVAQVFSDCPEVEWVAGASLICSPEGRPFTINAPPGFNKALFFSGRYLGGHPAWNGRWVPQESVFWRRSLWEKAGSRFCNERFGDFELWSRFWSHADLHVLPVPLAVYRCHPDTYTATQGHKSTEPCTKIIEASGLGKYRPWQIRWRNMLCRLGDRVARRLGEPAKCLEFDLEANHWRVVTRYVM